MAYKPKPKFFKGYSAAKNWADKKNAKSKVIHWVVKDRKGDYGYDVVPQRYRYAA